MESGHLGTVDALLALARDRSAAGRRRLSRVIDDLFLAHRDVLSDRDSALMTEILRQLVLAVELPIRRGLAERLAELPDTPPDLMLALANEELELAFPRLIQSDLLHHRELIELVHHRALEHQLAVSIRKMCSESASELAPAADGTDVIKGLIEHGQGRLAPATMDYLVEQSRRVDTYQNPLLPGAELPRGLSRRLGWWVAAAVRLHLMEGWPVPIDALDDCLELVVAELNRAAPSAEGDQAARLAALLAAEQAITPRLLVECLRDAEVALFAALFGRLTGIRRQLLFRLLFETGGQGLCIACKAIGVDRSTFVSIYLLTRNSQGGEAGGRLAEVTQVLSLYDRIEAGAAAAILRNWQRDPLFLEATWRLERPRRIAALA